MPKEATRSLRRDSVEAAQRRVHRTRPAWGEAPASRKTAGSDCGCGLRFLYSRYSEARRRPGGGGVGATGAGGVAGAGLVGAGATGAAEAAGPAAPVMPAEARAGRRPPLPAGAGAPDVTGAFPPAGFFGLGPPGGRLEMLAAARL